MPNIPVDKRTDTSNITDILISTRMYLDTFMLICARYFFNVITVYTICTAHLRKNTQIQTKHMPHSKTISTLVIWHVLYIFRRQPSVNLPNEQNNKTTERKPFSSLSLLSLTTQTGAWPDLWFCNKQTNTQASKQTDHINAALRHATSVFSHEWAAWVYWKTFFKWHMQFNIICKTF